MTYNKSKFKAEKIAGNIEEATHTHKLLGGGYKVGAGTQALKYNVVEKCFYTSQLTNVQLINNSLYTEIQR